MGGKPRLSLNLDGLKEIKRPDLGLLENAQKGEDFPVKQSLTNFSPPLAIR